MNNMHLRDESEPKSKILPHMTACEVYMINKDLTHIPQLITNSPEHAGIDSEEGLSEVLEGGSSQVAVLGQYNREAGLVLVVNTLMEEREGGQARSKLSVVTLGTQHYNYI